MSACILIIEDDSALAETIRYTLIADGFQALCRGTGAAGLAALDGVVVDLVLLDVGLPDVNGFDLFHRLREATAAPIMFLTARSDEIDKVVGLEQGADDYITKPFSPRELTARVRTVLRRVQRGQDDGADAGAPAPSESVPFTVDDEKRCIRFFGSALHLTRYEYGLLRTLIRRPGRVFSREELLEQVWTDPGEACDRTVDAHVRSLRVKLKAVNPACEPIRTHRGLGYSLGDTW